MDVRKHVPSALTSAGEGENGAGATPGKSKARTAVAVVVNDAAAVEQLLRAQADSRASERSQSNAFGQDFWRLDLQHATALGENLNGLRRIRVAIRAQRIGSAKDAIVRPRDCVHEGRIVANHCVVVRHLWNNHDLAAMGLDFGIWHECLRADAGAIDQQRAIALHVFNLFELNPGVNLTARALEARSEIIEIACRVRERNLERESAC